MNPATEPIAKNASLMAAQETSIANLTLEVSGRGRSATSLARHSVRGPLERIVRMQHATKEQRKDEAPAGTLDCVKR
jgi:hypothetical protein